MARGVFARWFGLIRGGLPYFGLPVDGGFQFQAGGEARDAFGGHLDSAPVARIAHAAGFAMGDSEGTETGDSDAIAARQTGLYALKKRVQRAGCLGAGETSIHCD